MQRTLLCLSLVLAVVLGWQGVGRADVQSATRELLRADLNQVSNDLVAFRDDLPVSISGPATSAKAKIIEAIALLGIAPVQTAPVEAAINVASNILRNNLVASSAEAKKATAELNLQKTLMDFQNAVDAGKITPSQATAINFELRAIANKLTRMNSILGAIVTTRNRILTDLLPTAVAYVGAGGRNNLRKALSLLASVRRLLEGIERNEVALMGLVRDARKEISKLITKIYLGPTSTLLLSATGPPAARIYDLRGQLMMTGVSSAGPGDLEQDARGATLANGVYFMITVEQGDYVVRKLVILR